MFPIIKLIVDTAAVILGSALLLRFWMQAIRVRPPQQLGHFIFTVSDWLVRPLRRIVPGVAGYDWASLIGAFIVVFLASCVYFMLQWSAQMVLLFAVHRFIVWIIYGFIGLLIIEAILSWVNPHAPMAPFIRALNEPILRPLRRFVPLVGGLDLSLLVAVLLLQIVLHVLGMLFALP